jgi:hypothetical protein
VLATPGKERITIRLDADILDYFRQAVDRAGGGNYQTAIKQEGRPSDRKHRAARDPRRIAPGLMKPSPSCGKPFRRRFPHRSVKLIILGQ